MRELSHFKLSVLTALLLVTAVFGYMVDSKNSREQRVNQVLLPNFATIPGWSGGNNIRLGDRIVQELALDDYLFRTYQGTEEQVTLYVGYYHSAKKIGSPHDPLVCFQGQGWQITSRQRGEYQLKGNPELKISYTLMVAEREAERDLIVYWFQANDRAASGTFAQKLAMLRSRFLGNREHNAFVRLSTPLKGQSTEFVRHRLFAFIEDFYPRFHAYVTGG